MPQNQSQLEEELVTRYKERWIVGKRYDHEFAYRERKGRRLVTILRETCGLPECALEVGVGPGMIAVAAAREGIRIIGVDLSEETLRVAKQNCEGHDIGLARASGFDLPFADRSFPLIFATQVLHLFGPEYRLKFLKEVHRVLNPGGTFVFDMLNRWTHIIKYLRHDRQYRKVRYPAKRELEGLLSQAGFSRPQRFPGQLPKLTLTSYPNLWLLRMLSQTIFHVTQRVTIRAQRVARAG